MDRQRFCVSLAWYVDCHIEPAIGEDDHEVPLGKITRWLERHLVGASPVHPKFSLSF